MGEGMGGGMGGMGMGMMGGGGGGMGGMGDLAMGMGTSFADGLGDGFSDAGGSQDDINQMAQEGQQGGMGQGGQGGGMKMPPIQPGSNMGPGMSQMGQHGFGAGAMPRSGMPSTAIGPGHPLSAGAGQGGQPSAGAMMAQAPGTGQRMAMRGAGGPGAGMPRGGMPGMMPQQRPGGGMPQPGMGMRGGPMNQAMPGMGGQGMGMGQRPPGMPQMGQMQQRPGAMGSGMNQFPMGGPGSQAYAGGTGETSQVDPANAATAAQETGMTDRMTPAPISNAPTAPQGRGMPDRVNTQGQPFGGQQQQRLQLDRQAQGAQLRDNPQLSSDFNKRINQEVGSQGPNARQNWIESTMNRANSRYGGDLSKAITGAKGDRSVPANQRYFPPGQSNPGALRQQGTGNEALINQALRGSNAADLATGNASGRAGAGEITARAGGEKFGIEKADRGYAADKRGLGPLGTIANLPSALTGGLIPPMTPSPGPGASPPPQAAPPPPPGVPPGGGATSYSPPDIPSPQSRPQGAPQSGVRDAQGMLPSQTAPQNFSPPGGQAIPGQGTWSPPRQQGAGMAPPPMAQRPPQAPPQAMPQQANPAQGRLDQQWANRPQFNYGGGQQAPAQPAGAGNAPPPNVAPQPGQIPSYGQQGPQGQLLSRALDQQRGMTPSQARGPQQSLDQRIQQAGQAAQRENFAGSPQGQAMMQGMQPQRPQQMGYDMTGRPQPGSQMTGASDTGGLSPSQAMQAQRGRMGGIPQQPQGAGALPTGSPAQASTAAMGPMGRSVMNRTAGYPAPQGGQQQQPMPGMQMGQPQMPPGTSQPQQPPGMGAMGQPQQPMSAATMASKLRQNNPALGHEGTLQALNQNQHRLDPQSRQQLQQINHAYQRERQGLPPVSYDSPPGHAGSYPWQAGLTQATEANQGRPPQAGGGAPARAPAPAPAPDESPVSSSERQAAGTASAATPRGSQGSVKQPKGGKAPPKGATARGPDGQVYQFDGKEWQPAQQQQGRGRGGKQGQGKQQKFKMPKMPKMAKAPRLHITPLKPVKRFHAR